MGVRVFCLFFLLSNTAWADLMVEEAWLRMGPPGLKNFAAYMKLKNKGSNTITIKGFKSPRFEKVELHKTSITKDGIGRMHRVDNLRLHSGEEIKLEPNSYHLMLMLADKTLQSGDKIPISIFLNNGKRLVINIIVKSE